MKLLLASLLFLCITIDASSKLNSNEKIVLKKTENVRLIQQNNQLIIQNSFTQLVFDLLRPSISSLSADFDGTSNYG